MMLVWRQQASPHMNNADHDTLIRMAAFEHVRRLGEIHDHLTATELKPGFVFQGDRIPLINPQRGIFKPQQMRFLLSIKTVFRSRAAKSGMTTSARCIDRFSMETRRSTMPSWARTPTRLIIVGFARRSSTRYRSSIASALHRAVIRQCFRHLFQGGRRGP